MHYTEFSAYIKKKYPQYINKDDLDLAKRYIAKHPIYGKQVTFDEPIQEYNTTQFMAPTEFKVPPAEPWTMASEPVPSQIQQQPVEPVQPSIQQPETPFTPQFSAAPASSTMVPQVQPVQPLPRPEDTMIETPGTDWKKVSSGAQNTYMKYFGNTGKFLADVGSLFPEGSKVFYDAIGLVPGRVGEWGDRMAASAKELAKKFRRVGQGASEAFEVSPEEQYAIDKGGIPAGLVVGAAQAVAMIEEVVATGGTAQAERIAAQFAQKYGPGAVKSLIPFLSRKTVNQLGGIISLAEVEAMQGEANAGETGTEKIVGTGKGALTGAALATSFSGASGLAEKITAKASPLVTNAVKRLFQGVLGYGMSAAEGGTTQQNITGGLFGLGMPVGPKDRIPSANKAKNEVVIPDQKADLDAGLADQQIETYNRLVRERDEHLKNEVEEKKLDKIGREERKIKLAQEKNNIDIDNLRNNWYIYDEGTKTYVRSADKETVDRQWDSFGSVRGTDSPDAAKSFADLRDKYNAPRAGEETGQPTPIQAEAKQTTETPVEPVTNGSDEVPVGPGEVPSEPIAKGPFASFEDSFTPEQHNKVQEVYSKEGVDNFLNGFEQDKIPDGYREQLYKEAEQNGKTLEEMHDEEKVKAAQKFLDETGEQSVRGQVAHEDRYSKKKTTAYETKGSTGYDENNNTPYQVQFNSAAVTLGYKPGEMPAWQVNEVTKYIKQKRAENTKIVEDYKAKKAKKTKQEPPAPWELPPEHPDRIAYQEYLDERGGMQEEAETPNAWPQPSAKPGESQPAVMMNGKIYTGTTHALAMENAFKDNKKPDPKTFVQDLFLKDGKLYNRDKTPYQNDMLGNEDLPGTRAAASIGEFSQRQKKGLPGKSTGEPPPEQSKEENGVPVTHAMEMPEAVEIVKRLTGRIPIVEEKLRAGHGEARGQFSPGNLLIKIKAELAKNPEQGLKTLAHELFHLIDALGDNAGEARGNLVGHLVSAKKNLFRYLAGKPGGMPPLTPKEMARLRRIAKQQSEDYYAKIIDEEIKKETPYTPQDILNIWNKVEGKVDPELFDYIARLSTEQKKSIIKEAMKGRVAESVPKKTETVTRTKKTVYVKETNPEKIAERYKYLIEAEIKKRQLLDNVREKKQLIDLGVVWQNFDPSAKTPYTKYRLRNEELYANFGSALLAEPELVRKMAPDVLRGWNNYLERKPEVKAIWDAIQMRIGKGEKAVIDERQKIREAGYKQAEEQKRAERIKQKEDQKKSKLNVVKSVYRGLFERGHMVYSAVEAAIDKGIIIPDELNPIFQWAGWKYKAEGKRLVYLKKSANIIKETQADIDWDSSDVITYMGSVLQDIRGAGELKEKFGPQAIQGELSEKQLARLKERLGPEKTKSIETGVKEYFDLRKEDIVPYLTEGPFGNSLSKDLRDKIKNNYEYSRRDIVKEFVDKHGEVAGASLLNMKSVKGTFHLIQNPLIATIIYDARLIIAKAKSDMIRSIVGFFETHQGDKDIVKNYLVEPAESYNTANGKRYQHIDNGTMKTVYYLEEGKLQARNVSKGLADIFERDLDHSDGVVDFISKTGNFQRALFIKFSLPFLIRNPIRDIAGSIKNVTQYGVNPWPVIKYTFKAFPEVMDWIKNGKMSADLEQAFKEGAMPVQRLYEDPTKISAHADTEIDNIQKMYFNNPVAHKNYAIRLGIKIDNFMDAIGQLEEKTRKLADYKFLKEEHAGIGTEERANIIRTRSGTPDVRAGGTVTPYTNKFLLFSNANLQGQRAASNAFMKDKKRYLAKFMLYDFAPKVFVALAKAGATAGFASWLAKKTGMDEKIAEYIQDAYELIPDQDLARYHCIPLPMRTESGKQFYLKIPSDYTGQTIGAIIYKSLGINKPKGVQKLAKEVAAISPISGSQLQPLFEIADGYWSYITTGNITDSWSGKKVIPESLEGTSKEKWPIAKWTYDQIGGSIFYKIPDNYDMRDKHWLENAMGLLIVGPALRAFIGVSDRGLSEKYGDVALKETMKAKEITATYKEKIVKSLKDGKIDGAKIKELYKEARASGYAGTPRVFRATYRKLSISKLGDIEMKALIGQPKEARKAVIESILDNKKLSGEARDDERRRLRRDERLFREIISESGEE